MEKKFDELEQIDFVQNIIRLIGDSSFRARKEAGSKIFNAILTHHLVSDEAFSKAVKGELETIAK